MEPAPLSGTEETKQTRPWIFPAVLLGCVCVAVVVLGVLVAVRRFQISPASGTAFVVDLAVPDSFAEDDHARELRIVEEVLRARLDDMGVRGAFETEPWAPLIVKVPQLDPEKLEEVRATLAATGLLGFHRVHEEPGVDPAGLKEPPSGYSLMALENTGGGKAWTEWLLVESVPEMTGEMIEKSTLAADEYGNPCVSLEFTREGARRFAEVTGTLAVDAKKTGEMARLAIVVDGKVYSAPRIMEEILGGHAQITGQFTHREALELVNLLNNPVSVPHIIVDEYEF